MMDTVQLEAGGVYMDRTGQRHGPLIAQPNPDYPFATPAGVTWTPGGHYISPQKPDRLDLIAIMQRGV
jgi:hypothetical protein